MEQVRLEKALLKLGEAIRAGVTLNELQLHIGTEELKQLSECGLINCQVALLDQGRYGVTWKSIFPFTPSGQYLLSGLEATQDSSPARAQVASSRWTGSFKYRQGF